MSENEDFYDTEVAPVLAELANKCAERGLHFLAQVEYDPGEFGLTRKFSDSPHLAMVMLEICALSRENIDGYVMNLLRYCGRNGVDVSGSMILHRYAGKSETTLPAESN